MHNILTMQVSQSLTNISKILSYIFFRDCSHFDFLEKSASICIFEDHISNFSFDINVDIDEFDYFRVGESIVHHYLIFCDFIDLATSKDTTFTATILVV